MKVLSTVSAEWKKWKFESKLVYVECKKRECGKDLSICQVKGRGMWARFEHRLNGGQGSIGKIEYVLNG